MKTKDLFVLAVRLLGLYFIAVGLKNLDVPAFMDLTILKGDDADDVISALLPVAYNVVIGWWLLRGNFLVRRAYPEPAKLPHYSSPAPFPVSAPVQSEKLSELEAAEKKLAALVANPRGDQASQ